MWRNQLFTRCLFLGLSRIIFGCGLSDDEIDPLPGIELSSTRVTISHLEHSGEFQIKNTGNIPLEWSLVTSVDYYLISPFNGKLAPGETVNPKITVFKDELTEGVFRSGISLVANQEIFNQIQVEIISFSEKKWLLDFRIVDAEYNSKMDRIVAATDNNSLLIMDAVNKTVATIHLEMPVIAISLHPNGKHALVGHIAALSLVDLEQQSILKQIGLPFEMFDLVAGPNNWVYINPLGYAQGTLYNLNLDDNQGQWSYDVSIYPKTRLNLHPSGKYIFAAHTTISPSKVYKIDISTGVARFVYDSPYHGEHNFGGKIWMSESGNQFFARTGSVFRISEDKAFDLTYMGKIPTEGVFSSINYSSKLGKIYGVHNQYDRFGSGTPNQDMLVRFNSTFQLIEETPLPNFLFQDISGYHHIIKARAQFGFFNSQSTEYLILSHTTDHVDPTFDKWALTSIPIVN